MCSRRIDSYVNFVKMHSVCGCECVDEISESSELREPLEIKTKFCRSCFKLVPYDKFLSHTRTNKLLVCASEYKQCVRILHFTHLPAYSCEHTF